MAAAATNPRYEKLLIDGQGFLARGQIASARNRFRDAVRLAPADARAHFLLGTALLAEKDAAGARLALAAADARAPGNPEVLANLGLAQAQDGDRAAGIATLRRALELRPGEPGIKLNLAGVLVDEGRAQEALDLLRDIDESREIACAVRLARSQALLALDRPSEALTAADAAASLEPDSPDVRHARFLALQRMGCYRSAVELARTLPGPEAALSAASCLARMGDARDAFETLDRAIRLAGGPAHAPVAMLQARAMRTIYDFGADPVRAARAHRDHGARLESAREFARHANSRDPERRLRVGFVSADFREHSVMCFFLEPLARFDRARIEPFLYSGVPEPDAITGRVRALASGYRDIRKLDADAAARAVREDAIDILIDLAGLTAGTRLDVFARRPAPVQATWAGYPYTTGLARVDLRLVDPVSDPPGEEEAGYTEKLVRLRHFLCFRPLVDTPAPAPRDGAGPIVFGAFNNPEKIDPPTVAHWAEVLKRCAGSRLVMRQSWLRFSDVRDAWRARFVSAGLAEDRLDFGPFVEGPGASYAIHDEVDICLDPLGYNGTTTTCQALWMGVPVIVTPGHAHAARVGASLMAAAGLPEFVARDPDDAIARIASLAADRPRLAAYRRTLRERVAASALCDAGAFARDFEAKLRLAWREWCAAA